METNNQESEKKRIIAKVKKLLAVAADGRGNQQEAETALRHAQALMVKYHLKEADLIEKEIDDLSNFAKAWRKSGRLTKRSFRPSTHLEEWCGLIVLGVCKLYDCFGCIGAIKDLEENPGKVFVFAGLRTDVELAAWTFDYLTDIVKLSSKRFSKEVSKAMVTGNVSNLCQEYNLTEFEELLDVMSLSPKTLDAHFKLAMAAMLQKRMIEMKEMEKYEFNGQVGGSRALMVIEKKKRKLEELFGVMNPNEKKMKKGSAAMIAGAEEGSKVEIKRNALEHKVMDKIED